MRLQIVRTASHLFVTIFSLYAIGSAYLLTPEQKLVLLNKKFPIANNPRGIDSYTPEEMKKIEILRSKIKEDLTHGYMFENRYLVRFLRKTNLDVDSAETVMHENFQWRKKQNIDVIERENLIDWQRRVPFYYNLDKDGRPGVLASLRDFDIRRMILAGEIDTFTRYFLSTFEHANNIIPIYSNYSGIEFIDGNIIFNAAGFNARAHMCLGCMPFWVEFLEIFENNYPLLVRRLLVINAPKITDRLYRFLKPFMTPAVVNAIKIFGVDKADWTEIFKIYPKNQLPLEFGGNAPKNDWKDVWLNPPPNTPPELIKQITPKYLRN